MWELARERLAQGGSVALLVVAASKGHSPGKPGAKLVVTADGAVAGSVGGGIMEHSLIQTAQCLLTEDISTPVVQRLVHDHRSGQNHSGLSCGGAQTVLICPLRTHDLPSVQTILEAIANRSAAVLTLSPLGFRATRTTGRREPAGFVMESQGHWRYEEEAGVTNTLYIIGGGHVSLALSRVMIPLDFHVVVLDEQPRETLECNHYAHEKVILSYDRVQEDISEGERSYVVIMTPSHQSDEMALRHLVSRRLAYLGMMGSKAKVRTIFATLRRDGIPEERLQAVRAPLGVPIHSHTPEEIAISIAAEIIRVKNGG